MPRVVPRGRSWTERKAATRDRVRADFPARRARPANRPKRPERAVTIMTAV